FKFIGLFNHIHTASIYTRTVPADITAGTETVLRMLPIRALFSFAHESPDWCAEQVFKYWLF
ncbi:hypothetical protein, partial [Collinsella sp. HCP28S3_E12]|uniref:hypothetical protein n=1 Tax=Collinsella sp. HCP28S3_E12 TaxID=3438921 RepID=UPI003F8CCAB2